MKMFLASMENQFNLISKVDHLKYMLISFFYLNKNADKMQILLDKCDSMLIDSGAFSFQNGKNVDFDAYTKVYGKFIKRFTDDPRTLGFFEMDIDKIVGYEKVKEYRKMLEGVSDKIIPVWHNTRGIDEYYKMCEEYTGKRIAIKGFYNEDIIDSQYNLFLNTAHHYGCKVHILGMTRLDFMRGLNLGKDDSFDSNTWLRRGIFGEFVLPKDKFGIKLIYALHGCEDKESFFDKINLHSFMKVQDNLDEIDQSVIPEGGGVMT